MCIWIWNITGEIIRNCLWEGNFTGQEGNFASNDHVHVFCQLKRKIVGTQEINDGQEIPILDPVRKPALDIWLVDLGTKNYFIDRVLEWTDLLGNWRCMRWLTHKTMHAYYRFCGGFALNHSRYYSRIAWVRIPAPLNLGQSYFTSVCHMLLICEKEIIRVPIPQLWELHELI